MYLAMGVVQVFAQEHQQTVEVSIDEFSHNLLKTSDDLYIAYSTDKYLMNKSPLSFFKGYKSIFGNNSKVTNELKADTAENIVIPYPPVRYGSVGKSEKNYTAYWILLDEKLYLYKIDFPASVKDEKAAYASIEDYIGVRFSNGYIALKKGIGKFYGLMPAIWCTDTLYVKKAVTKEDPFFPIDSWTVKPYLQMIFNKGELTSKKIIDNEIHTRKIVVPRGKSR